MIIEPKPTDALIVIDYMHDFLPGGPLAVPGGDEIAPVIDMLGTQYDNIILIQDWHPAGHVSFASSHAGKAPFEMTELPYGDQVLWPDHCIQGTPGAEFDLPSWLVDKAQAVIRKGYRPDIDSYSAFLENDQKTPTGLAGLMRERGLTRAVCVGLALDYCVGFSAIDARKMGFDATVYLEGTRGIAEESIAERTAQMKEAGVVLL
jgi:nicotinamidase/pyrazinamidase